MSPELSALLGEKLSAVDDNDSDVSDDEGGGGGGGGGPSTRLTRSATATLTTTGDAAPNLAEKTVKRAFAGNFFILGMKAYVWWTTGATVAAVETLHSLGDAGVQGMLYFALTRMIGTKRSERSRAQGRHHFGVGRMAFSFGLMGAIGIFWVEGITSLLLSAMRGHAGYALDVATAPTQMWYVLAASAAIEAAVLWATVRDVVATKKDGESVRAFLGRVRDPFVKTVLYEDAYALFGIACAGAGMYGALHTGTWHPDTAFAVLDGCGLVYVSYALLRFYYPFLLGRSAGERTGGIKRVLNNTDGIAQHTRDQSLWISPDEMFYKADLDFDSRAVATMLRAQEETKLMQTAAAAGAGPSRERSTTFGRGARAGESASGVDFVAWRRRWRNGELDDAAARKELHVLLGRYAEGVSQVHEGIIREAEREIKEHYPGCVFIDLEPEVRSKAQWQREKAAEQRSKARWGRVVSRELGWQQKK